MYRQCLSFSRPWNFRCVWVGESELEQEEEGFKCKLGHKKDVKSNMKMNTKIIEARIKDNSKLCCYTKMIFSLVFSKNNQNVVWLYRVNISFRKIR